MSSGKKETTVQGLDTFPAPVYRRTVLEEIFQNAKVYFLEPLLAIECAHTLMLARQKIIPKECAAICLRGLEQFDVEQIRREPYDPRRRRPLLPHREEADRALWARACRPDADGRSRNDVDMTMYRMVLRSRTLSVLRSLLALREVIVRLAWDHRASLITGTPINSLRNLRPWAIT